MSASKTRNLHVLVATPLGHGGKGGIDRMMDALREEFRLDMPEGMSVRFGTTRGQGSILLSPFFLLTFLIRMIILRLFGRCDLVHINLSSDGSTWRKLVIAAVAFVFRIRYVGHLHSGRYPTFFSSLHPYLQARVRTMFRRSEKLFVLGAVWQNFVIEMGLAEAGRVIILPNAVPEPRQEWRPAKDGKTRLLFLGRLGPNKGTPQLVEALGKLRNRSNWIAVLAGDGDLSTTRAAVAQLDMDERVRIPGWIGPERIEALLAESDILILPSFSENLPMSVIEGMAAGLAVVTTPVGAIPDIVHDGRTGLLVPVGDVQALSEAIERLIEDLPLRHRLVTGAKAFQRQKLSIKGYAGQLCEHWRAATQ